MRDMTNEQDKNRNATTTKELTATAAKAITTNGSYDELKWNVAFPLDHASSADDDCPITNTTRNGGDRAASPTTATSEKPEKPNNNSSSFLPLHAETTALLIVDVQPEYWSQCPAVRRDFPDFPRNLERTVDTCRKQGCTKIIWVRADYRYSHSPWLKQFARIHGLQDDIGGGGAPSSGSSSSSSPDDAKNDDNDSPSSVEFRVEVPCDPRDTDRFTWEEFAVPAGGEVIIPKPSWSSTSNTALTDVLQASSVDTVLVCGLITSVCVQHSAFGIFEAGYRTVMVTDACADRGRARHEAALALYGDYMYELLTSEELESETSTRRLRPARPIFILPTKHRGPMSAEEECDKQCRRFYESSPASSPSSLVPAASSLSSATSSSSSSLSSFTEFTI